MLRLVGSLVLSGVLLVGIVPIAQAQSGFCLLGCAKDPDLILNYRIEDKQHNFSSDRYFLWIKPQQVATKEIQVVTDTSFDGQFSLKSVEVNSRTANKSYKVEDVAWDAELRTLTIVLDKPLPAQEEIEVVASQVLNPRSEGIYKFNARVLGTEPNPIYRYVGTWSISIE